MIKLIGLVPILPLIGFLINGLGRNRIPKKFVGLIGSATILVSFILSLGAFFELSNAEIKSYTYTFFDWISAGAFHISFSFLIDPLSILMLLVITGVGFLIHVYSIGYMYHDEGFARYFAYLNLFVFFMLLLVLGSNYVIMFIGWEGVGLCSYLLIGFWFKNQEYNNAAKKAFIMNRIGDLGFLIGLFMLYTTFGSINYNEVFSKTVQFNSGNWVLTVITLLLFLGATGKSAQIPLYTWLPDAMAGPTPVSALIHAATMVTAGIYMIARSSAIFVLAPLTMSVISIIGITTAIVAAIIALTQTDIKKILAYSTVSQLGYMFLALGVGAFTGAVFHLMTHAFFKALLFLGAGSVIHAMGGEQDIRKMGALKKILPITFLTMFIATIAISGIPPFSGFFSKDEILAYAFEKNPLLWLLGLIGALLTTFYIFRMLYLTFYGKFRGTQEQQNHLHESPKSMTTPLIVLAVLSIIGGFINIPKLVGGSELLHHYLEPVFLFASGHLTQLTVSHNTEYILMAASVVGVVLSMLFAYNKYVKKGIIPPAETEKLSSLHKLSYHKFYVDEFYTLLFTKPINKLSEFLHKKIETFIDILVNGSAKVVVAGSRTLRLLQTGKIGFYIFAMVVGIILILFLNFL